MINNQSFSIRCCDPDRIQTCNLLIRSQMLYSVEPRGLSLNCDAKEIKADGYKHVSTGYLFHLILFCQRMRSAERTNASSAKMAFLAMK